MILSESLDVVVDDVTETGCSPDNGCCLSDGCCLFDVRRCC